MIRSKGEGEGGEAILFRATAAVGCSRDGVDKKTDVTSEGGFSKDSTKTQQKLCGAWGGE